MKLRKNKTRQQWQAALLTGLFAGIFSTLAIILAAPRIGRPVSQHFMEISTLALRGRGVRSRPNGRTYIAGVLVHMLDSLAWASVFFGLLARWTRRIRPATLAGVAPLWSAFAAAVDYYVILPWLQPLHNIQTPYWLVLGEHAASTLAYPSYYLVRSRVKGLKKFHMDFARRWMVFLAGFTGVLGIMALLGESGRELRWPFRRSQANGFDARFLQRMVAHNEVGSHLAHLAAEKSHQEGLREIGRLMEASKQSEIQRMRSWYRGWFGNEISSMPAGERFRLPGVPSMGEMDDLERLSAVEFETTFIPLMVRHHNGGIEMAQEAMQQAADPRLRLYARQVSHALKHQSNRLIELLGSSIGIATAEQQAAAAPGYDSSN